MKSEGDECLNQHWYLPLNDAGQKVETWRRGYNDSALDNMTPEAFRLRFEQKLENDKINREPSFAVV